MCGGGVRNGDGGGEVAEMGGERVRDGDDCAEVAEAGDGFSVRGTEAFFGAVEDVDLGGSEYFGVFFVILFANFEDGTGDGEAVVVVFAQLRIGEFGPVRGYDDRIFFEYGVDFATVINVEWDELCADSIGKFHGRSQSRGLFGGRELHAVMFGTVVATGSVCSD